MIRNDSFFLFTGINWSASLLPATAGHFSEDCICALSCGAALGTLSIGGTSESFRQARVVNKHVSVDSWDGTRGLCCWFVFPLVMINKDM